MSSSRQSAACGVGERMARANSELTATEKRADGLAPVRRRGSKMKKKVSKDIDLGIPLKARLPNSANDHLN